MSNNKNLHPIVWIAAVAIIAVSGVGIAKMSGFIGDKSIEPIAGSADKTTVKDAVRTPVKRTTPRDDTSPRNGRDPSVNSYPAKHRACSDCGVIEAVRKVEVPIKPSGLGAVAGGVVGGVIGHQASEGHGKDVATVAGAVLGGLAGHQVEKRVRTQSSYEVDVTMQDGSLRTVPFAGAPGWQRGDEVQVRNGVISSAGKGQVDSL